jgi:hypothetical protein
MSRLFDETELPILGSKDNTRDGYLGKALEHSRRDDFIRLAIMSCMWLRMRWVRIELEFLKTRNICTGKGRIMRQFPGDILRAAEKLHNCELLFQSTYLVESFNPYDMEDIENCKENECCLADYITG